MYVSGWGRVFFASEGEWADGEDGGGDCGAGVTMGTADVRGLTPMFGDGFYRRLSAFIGG